MNFFIDSKCKLLLLLCFRNILNESTGSCNGGVLLFFLIIPLNLNLIPHLVIDQVLNVVGRNKREKKKIIDLFTISSRSIDVDCFFRPRSTASLTVQISRNFFHNSTPVSWAEMSIVSSVCLRWLSWKQLSRRLEKVFAVGKSAFVPDKLFCFTRNVAEKIVPR